MSKNQFPWVIHDFVSEGILQNRIAGPFSAPPFEHFVVSPLGVVPKSEVGKYRVIHDLSFPKQHSVNDLIPPENSNVQYESIDNITTLLNQFGQDSLMAKTDIKDAFRIIPIHPDDYKFLGFSWHGSIMTNVSQWVQAVLVKFLKPSVRVFNGLCTQNSMWGVCPTC